MIEPAGTRSADARGAKIPRGVATFLSPFVLAALLGALAPARLAGASLGKQAITVGSATGTYSVVLTTTALRSSPRFQPAGQTRLPMFSITSSLTRARSS